MKGDRPREAVPQPRPSPGFCFSGWRVWQCACQSGEGAALDLPLRRNQLTRPAKTFYAFYLFLPGTTGVGVGARGSGEKGQQGAECS